MPVDHGELFSGRGGTVLLGEVGGMPLALQPPVLSMLPPVGRKLKRYRHPRATVQKACGPTETPAEVPAPAKGKTARILVTMQTISYDIDIGHPVFFGAAAVAAAEVRWSFEKLET
jgi:hypothetical protein